jgi:hypothetical protein
MNRTIITHVLLLCTVLWCCSEPPRFLGLSEPALKERGPHHRTWERVSSYVTSYGRVVNRTSSVQEIGTGICYWDGAEWKDTEEVFELFRDGAVARKGPHQVIISPRITDAPAIDMLTPDGKRLRCRLFGVVYRDTITGNNVLVAEPNPDSIATLVPPNRIVWENALLDFAADLQLTYTRAGVEAELILRERPDAPDAWNLSAKDTRIQVWTEWFDPPEPRKDVEVVREETDPNLRQVMADPQVIDETLDFGHMRFVQGRAFRIGEGTDAEAVRVAKQWVNLENGRTFLIESVDYLESKPMLDGLPLADARQALPAAELARRAARTPAELVAIASFRGDSEIGTFASRQVKVVSSGSDPQLRASAAPTLRVAQERSRRAGVSIDWTAVSSQSNFVFKSDTTYACNSAVTLSGTTIIEGGTVVKFSNQVSGASIMFTGPVDCRTSRFRPAFFTARDDHTVGEIVGNITNTIGTNVYAGNALRLQSSGTSFDLHDFRMRYLHQAVLMTAGSLKLSHSQIGYGNSGVILTGTSLLGEVQNVLLHDLTWAFNGSTGHTNRGLGITVHRCGNLRGNSMTLYLTNSLIVRVTNNVVFSGANIETNQNEAGYFQTVGAGQRYLATNSPLRNAGTTNISATLLQELKVRTTYPPVVLGDISATTVLAPQAQRDTDLPDIGYHYDPADFLIGAGGITLSNSTLTVTNGAVVAVDSGITNWGLRLHSGAILASQGTASSPNRFVGSDCIQETPSGVGSNTVPVFADTFPAPASPAAASFRFTHFSLVTGGHLFNQPDGQGTLGRIEFRDSEIRGGVLKFSAATNAIVFAWTNALFDRAAVILSSTNATTFDCRNNLFREGSLSVSPASGSSWTIKDTFFDKPVLKQTATNSMADATYSHLALEAASWSSRPCTQAGAPSHVFIRTPQHTGHPHPVLSS